MAERAEATLQEMGVDVAHHDLYAEGFEPVCGGDALGEVAALAAKAVA